MTDRPQIPADPTHAVLVVIPTVANPPTLVPTFARIAADAEGRARQGLDPIAVVLAVNTNDPKGADDALHACLGIMSDANSRHPGCLDVEVCRWDSPIGFGAANNRGVMAAIARWGGVPELTVFHNDDAHVPGGWLERLLAALRTRVVHGYSEPWNPEDPRSRRPDHPVEQYGRVGLVGPVSNLVAGIQQATVVQTPDGLLKWDGHVERFAAACGQRYSGQYVTADFLSGFCVGLSRECMSDLMLEVADEGVLGPWHGFDENLEETPLVIRGSTAEATQIIHGIVGPWDEVTYPCAGYEDNDLMVRAELASWRALVAADCFVAHIGHQTFDRLFPEALRGLRNRAPYYERWKELTNPDRELKLVGVYRLKFEVGHDLLLMRQSLLRAARACDAVAILLTGNPLEVRADVRWPEEERAMRPEERDMLQACSGLDPDGVCAIVRAWAENILVNAQDSRVVPGQVLVDAWKGEFNERDERNQTHAMAEGLGADWILSIDHDEVIEDRVGRRHFERLMRHPDPLVREYDQGWQNHWDSIRLCREDQPWGDGGRYVGGMHGFRLWRLPRSLDGTLAAPRRIMAGTPNGLHCGNSPDHDLIAKRVSGIRFRHFGYLRVQDRHRKRQRYRVQDPDATADRTLTGAKSGDPYGHLIGEEGMRLTPFVQINGIGLHILMHRGEQVEDLARLLDWLYPLVDRIVLVWTDPWDEADQTWLDPVKPRVAQDVAEYAERRRLWTEGGGQVAGIPVPEPPRLRAARGAGGLARPFPIAWPTTGPSQAVAEMAARFGCEWVHQPLEDHLGDARNAGLEALGSDSQGLGWSLFMDLDEHFSEPFANMVALRRAAECTDAYGWLVTFRNHHRGAEASGSESVRMARLVPEMRFYGRVHETFDHAVQQIRATGQDVVVRVAPFVVEHIGLDRDDASLDAKLKRYQRMLVKELDDHPHNSSAWVSLALHEFNDGRVESGEECLRRAVACAGDTYLGFQQLGFHHIRTGTALLQAALDRCSPQHDFYRVFKPMLDLLRKHVPNLPILGSAQQGIATTDPIELPDFPIPAEGA